MSKMPVVLHAAALAFIGAAAAGCSQDGGKQESAYSAEETEDSQSSQMAQDQSVPPAQPSEATPAAPEAAPPAAADDASAVKVGEAVFESGGQEIGKIAELATAEDGSEMAVISVGGFLGMEPKKIAVSADSLRPSVDGKGVAIPMTAEEVDAAPPYEAKAESTPGASPEGDVQKL